MTKETKGKINSNLKELKKWFDSVYRGKPVELRLDDEDFYVWKGSIEIHKSLVKEQGLLREAI